MSPDDEAGDFFLNGLSDLLIAFLAGLVAFKQVKIIIVCQFKRLLNMALVC